MAAPSALLILALWTGETAAQTNASTGVISQPQAAEAQSDAIDSQIAAWTAPPGDPNGAPDRGAAPRQIHGEAGVAIGGNGYRAGYVTTEIPVGSDSTLGIGVGESQVKLKDGPTIKDKSLALSLVIGDPQIPAGCGDTVRVNNENMEPLWVTHLRGAPLAADQPACSRPAAP
jgi:hypothetical protein